MTSTKPGAQVGGYRTEVDQQRLGPALLITAGLILEMRTIRWEATHSDGLAGEEWEKEVEHSARVAKQMLTFLTTRYPDLFQSRKCRGMLRQKTILLNRGYHGNSSNRRFSLLIADCDWNSAVTEDSHHPKGFAHHNLLGLVLVLPNGLRSIVRHAVLRG